jgi:hypothetical protein
MFSARNILLTFYIACAPRGFAFAQSHPPGGGALRLTRGY